MADRGKAPETRIKLPRRIVVSGAGGGIGGEIARHLASAGVEVVGVGRSATPPSDWRAGGWIGADVASSEGRAAILAQAGEEIGGLVFAAGVLDAAGFDQIDDVQAEALLKVNLLAPYFLTRDLLPRLSPEASVVIIGSIAGTRASPATPLYAASKAALRNLSASLAVLLAPRGVRVNLLAPGLIDTPLTDTLNRDLAQSRGISVNEVAQERCRAIPMQRAGSVREVAEACAFLLSPASSYFTGASLFPTGGAMAGSI